MRSQYLCWSNRNRVRMICIMFACITGIRAANPSNVAFSDVRCRTRSFCESARTLDGLHGVCKMKAGLTCNPDVCGVVDTRQPPQVFSDVCDCLPGFYFGVSRSSWGSRPMAIRTIAAQT
jgi:hypothetical protein